MRLIIYYLFVLTVTILTSIIDNVVCAKFMDLT